MSQEPFGEVPLFRELQRLLSSGSGPVNFEIAGQVGRALASEGHAQAAVDPQLEATLAAAVRDSEVLLAAYTRLDLVEPMRARVITPAGWVSATLHAWKWLFEHLASHFVAQLGRLAGEHEPNPLQAALGQVSPLLVGIQVGTLMGHLARESLGHYDLPVPRDDDGRLTFIGPNVQRVARDYDVPLRELAGWLALHDCSRHLVATTVPWFPRFHRALLVEIVDSMELDAGELERRLMELQTKGIEGLQDGASTGEVLPLAESERHKRALRRLRSLLAVLEGYADHAAAAVGEKVVGDAARIDEVMTRHRASPSTSQTMLAGVLGVSVDRSLEQAGRTFCNAVVRLKGLTALNRIWDAPDNLPSFEEIRDPFAWMERVLQN